MDSIYPTNDRNAWIKALRFPRSPIDPNRPVGCFLEQELAQDGHVVDSAVFLLACKECPWTCLMCDLWKHTIPESLPSGAIVRQIQWGLNQLNKQPEQVKLYNSGSFFDASAIPVADYVPIANTISFAKHVIVESHPLLIGHRALMLRDVLSGSLEVAMGLETVHPDVLPRLNKRFELDEFAAACRFLLKERIGVRAFVLIQLPFLAATDNVKWAVKSAEFAYSCGASTVSLIPTRMGNGAMEALMAAGEFTPPSLEALEETFIEALKLGQGRAFIDIWDLEKFASCPHCIEPRRQRLHWMNLNQKVLAAVKCSYCQDATT